MQAAARRTFDRSGSGHSPNGGCPIMPCRYSTTLRHRQTSKCHERCHTPCPPANAPSERTATYTFFSSSMRHRSSGMALARTAASLYWKW